MIEVTSQGGKVREYVEYTLDGTLVYRYQDQIDGCKFNVTAAAVFLPEKMEEEFFGDKKKGCVP